MGLSFNGKQVENRSKERADEQTRSLRLRPKTRAHSRKRAWPSSRAGNSSYLVIIRPSKRLIQPGRGPERSLVTSISSISSIFSIAGGASISPLIAAPRSLRGISFYTDGEKAVGAPMQGGPQDPQRKYRRKFLRSIRLIDSRTETLDAEQ